MAAVATGVEERLLIGGEWVEAGDGRRFDVTDPGTGEVVGSVPDAGAERRRAPRSTRPSAALDGWKALPAIERARILRRAADLIRERSDRDRARDDLRAGQAARRGRGRGRLRGQLPRVVRRRGRARLRTGRAAEERRATACSCCASPSA